MRPTPYCHRTLSLFDAARCRGSDCALWHPVTPTDPKLINIPVGNCAENLTAEVWADPNAKETK